MEILGDHKTSDGITISKPEVSTRIVGRKYRLYPNEEQAALMREYFGTRRSIHNIAVEQRRTAYEIAGKSLSYSKQCAD